MAWWKVSTADKKSVEEHEIWEKDGMKIIRISGFRWGTFNVETNDDNPPEFELSPTPYGTDDHDSVDMYNCCVTNIESTELDNLDDGWYGNIIWDDALDDDQRERLEELWEEDYYDGWENDGWMLTDTECWFSGKLEVQRAEN